MVTDMAHLNAAEVRDFLGCHKASVLLSYGVHMLAEPTLRAAKVDYRWNLHGGLSPWYRGCITHFWPSYLLEPQMTGCTIHELTAELDFGPVVQQSVADLVPGDGLHDLSCRAVKKAIDQLPALISAAGKNAISSVSHRTTGRLWRAADWRPEHLEVIYSLYQDQIVDRYLAGELVQSEPRLIVQRC
ncbi:MAG: hypothetical protein KDI88_04010 [Gammaproteobacteria bacterium]|nr:hypothetical protein [Gammaproteobacteria bacterium]